MLKNTLKKVRCRPSTFAENCTWLSRKKIFLRNFRPRVNIFAHKCAWIREGNFSSDPELFEKSVLGYIEGYKKVLSWTCTFRDKCAWLYVGV